MNFKYVFFAILTLTANSISPTIINKKIIEDLANYKGRKLETESSLSFLLKKIDPVTKFKTKITGNMVLLEAIYHTDIILENALKDLMLVESADLMTPENIKTLLESEDFTNVMKAIELVVLALQSVIIKEKLIDQDGKLTGKGEATLKCIKSIISQSLQRAGLRKDSHLMEILDTLGGGKHTLENALEKMKKSWADPHYAIKCVMEIRVFAVDVCHDVPAIRKHKESAKYRSATECFDAYIEKLKKSSEK